MPTRVLHVCLHRGTRHIASHTLTDSLRAAAMRVAARRPAGRSAARPPPPPPRRPRPLAPPAASPPDVPSAAAAAPWAALLRTWGPRSAADAPRVLPLPADVLVLLTGALFLALQKWQHQAGNVYLLPTGLASSFLIVSDPAAAKHILRGYPLYEKGLVREVSEFLFGSGFAVAEGDLWKGRRRAVLPSLHKAYLDAMVRSVFVPCTERAAGVLGRAAASGAALDIEALFSQLTLDIIGRSLFNYDYDSLTKDSPVIQAVYVALKETEMRATDLVPFLWKVPEIAALVPRQQKAAAAVEVIRATTQELIAKCKAIVEAENEVASLDSEYVNAADPSVLRFLLASRVEVTESQLRDDLLSMLVAGHETTAAVLTWTLKLLAEHPAQMAAATAEADAVFGPALAAGGPGVGAATAMALPYVYRCVAESMRLYPHPPVLIRRATSDDTLPGGQPVAAGQDSAWGGALLIFSVENLILNSSHFFPLSLARNSHHLRVQHPPLRLQLGRPGRVHPRAVPCIRADAQRNHNRLPVHPLLGGATQVRGRPVRAPGGGHRAGRAAAPLRVCGCAGPNVGDDHRRNHPPREGAAGHHQGEKAGARDACRRGGRAVIDEKHAATRSPKNLK